MNDTDEATRANLARFFCALKRLYPNGVPTPPEETPHTTTK